eukprot:scaffold20809_cov125-Isochrysis_galbana.AAC.2
MHELCWQTKRPASSDCLCRSEPGGKDRRGHWSLSGLGQQAGCENAGVARVSVSRPAGPPP